MTLDMNTSSALAIIQRSLSEMLMKSLPPTASEPPQPLSSREWWKMAVEDNFLVNGTSRMTLSKPLGQLSMRGWSDEDQLWDTVLAMRQTGIESSKETD